MKLLAKLTMPVAVFAWLSLPVAVYTAYLKRYPGASCQPMSGANASAFNTTNAVIVNNSLISRLVTCPIVRDNDSNVEGNVVIRINVQSPTNQIVSCTAATVAPGPDAGVVFRHRPSYFTGRLFGFILDDSCGIQHGC